MLDSLRFKKNLMEDYPEGAIVVLDYMEGEPQMKAGLKGVITFVDDAMQIHVQWENGSSLALVPGTDVFHLAD